MIKTKRIQTTGSNKTRVRAIALNGTKRMIKVEGIRVKEFLRAQATRTYHELDQAITNTFNAIMKKDIIGWFTHCCYYIAPN